MRAFIKCTSTKIFIISLKFKTTKNEFKHNYTSTPSIDLHHETKKLLSKTETKNDESR